jgi:uncharacterized damage-inducible protein DinB
MIPSRVRPAYDDDERTQLIGWLDLQRAIIAWKCEDLPEQDAHRAVLPSSPDLTMAGLVSHLVWTEHCWFEVVMLGRPETGPQFEEGPEDADFTMAAGVPLAELVEEYGRRCALSNEAIAARSLERIAEHPKYKPSLRWTLLHMIEETARHAGHADAIRELLDGRRGYY